MISSLWAVPDFSTALLIEKFYHNHLIEHMDIAAALHSAQLWLRNLSLGEVATHAEQWHTQFRQKNKSKEELSQEDDVYELLIAHYHRRVEHNSPLHPFAHPYYWAAFTVNGW